jgi:hypothetical protein
MPELSGWVWLAGHRQGRESSYILAGWIGWSFLFAPIAAALGRAGDAGAQQTPGLSARQALRRFSTDR